MRYIWSGNLTDKMVEYLTRMPEFEPMDVLVSQLDRPSIIKMIEYKKKGVVNELFIDSGAFSQYTEKIGKIDVDEYCDFVNSIDEYVFLVAQVDTLPGKMNKPKKSEDYEESAKKSWENYLYMRTKLKSPEKLISVMHFGESMDTLRNMLEWRGENGEVVNVIGLSPANDTHQTVKDQYLQQCYQVISESSRPDAKTHLFGMTSLQALAKFPFYSADSVSHRLRSAYNKVFLEKYGTIALSDRVRTTKNKSNASFLKQADEDTYKDLESIFAHYGFTPDDMINDNAARVAVDIIETQQALKHKYKYDPKNLVKTKKLFDF